MCRAIAAAALVLCLVQGSASAQDGQEPKTRIAGLAAVSGNVGALGSAYAFGWMLGAEAGLQPGVLGVAWSILLGQFFLADESIVDRTPFVIDMAIHLRLRIRVPSGGGGIPAFILIQAGGEAIRSGVPLPPDGERGYIGPSVGLGGEMVLGKFSITFEGRYGMLLEGPQGLKLLVSFGVGAR